MSDTPNIYTSFDEAYAELARRRLDSTIVARMQQLFREIGVPFSFSDPPPAVYCRAIMTPNNEFRRLHALTAEKGVPLVLLEYETILVGKSNDSYHLCRLRFEHPHDTGTTCVRIVNFNEYEGKPLSEIHTLRGDALRAVHRKLFGHDFPEHVAHVHDSTTWFYVTRSLSPHYYYYYFLSLFLVHGVLFDNYLVGEATENSFFHHKVYPSFRAIEQEFGLRPLIVPLLPFESEGSDRWVSYPPGDQLYLASLGYEH